MTHRGHKHRAWAAALALAAAAAQPASLASPLPQLTPGKTTRAEVRQRLGEPAEGRGTPAETFADVRPGLAAVTVSYNEDDIVRWARLRLAKQMPPDVAALLFDTTCSPELRPGHPLEGEGEGTTLSYAGDGVHLYVREGVVREVVLAALERPVRGSRVASEEPPAEEPGREEATAPISPSAMVPLPPDLRPPQEEREPERPEPPAVAPPPLPDVPGPPQPRPEPVTPGPSREPPAEEVATAVLLRPLRLAAGEPPAFLGFVVGKSSHREAVAALGEPRFVSRRAGGGALAVHDGRPLGLHALVLVCDAAGGIEEVELQFARPVERDEVAGALGLGAPDMVSEAAGAAVDSYAEKGVEVTVRGDEATGLRLARSRVLSAEAEVVAALPEPEESPPAPPEKSPPLPPPEPEPAPEPRPEPEPEPAPEPERFPPLRAPGVQVRRVWCEHGVQVGGRLGMAVKAQIRAAGLRDQVLRVSVRFRHLDGRPVLAARGAPRGCADPRGRLCVTGSDRVLYDRAGWEAFQVFVPYGAIALPRGREHQVVVMFGARCGRQAHTREAGCKLRLP
ncbi:MAG: hypothetical protein ACLF0G_01145 [Candidatus Brocadiia bacterium]